MKKILGVLGAIGMVATSASTVVSCGNKGETDYKLDLTSEDYNTLAEVEAYIISENGEGTEVMFFSSVDSAKVMYDAANNDNDGDDAILAATEDYNAFKKQYGGYSASISRIESFAYMAASSNENDEPTNPVYGTITNSAK
jgi:hypothetical protein